MNMYNYKTFDLASSSYIKEAVDKEGEWNGYSDEWRIATTNDLTISLNDKGSFDCKAYCPDIIFLEIKNLPSFDAAIKYLGELNRIIIELYYKQDSI